MKIAFLKRGNKRFSEFKIKEWEKAHPELYDKKLDWSYWDKKRIRIKAEEGKIMAGVFHIEELIVDHDKRDLGIGRNLLENAERFAKKSKAHIAYLETGEDWKAVSFYEKLGFRRQTLIKDFYDHKNFWLMVKYL